MRSLNSSLGRWAQDHRDGLIVLGSFIASVFFGGVIIALFGADPIDAYKGMMIGGAGRPGRGFGDPGQVDSPSFGHLLHLGGLQRWNVEHRC